MSDEPKGDVPVNFIDNPHAPEVFASAATGFFHHRGNITITFESPRVDHVTTPGPINRVVLGRLVMPEAGAHQLAVDLFAFLKQQGVEFADPSGGAVQ